MSLVPSRPHPHGPDPEHPALGQRDLTREERRQLDAVRVAHWRARELAVHVFGSVARSALLGGRSTGPIRAILRLDVPFEDLSAHRDRERIFFASVRSDPLLARIPFVYVVGPAEP